MITWATPCRPPAILNWSVGALQIVKPMRKITVPRLECMDGLRHNRKCFQEKNTSEVGWRYQSHGLFDVWVPLLN